MLKKLWDAVNGNKTDMGVIAAGIYSILLTTTNIETLINPELIWTAIGMWTGVAVRDAIRKTQK